MTKILLCMVNDGLKFLMCLTDVATFTVKKHYKLLQSVIVTGGKPMTLRDVVGPEAQRNDVALL